jgi:hypothetical protein
MNVLHFFISILAGLVAVPCVLVFGYFLTVMLDNYCCCFKRSDAQHLLTCREMTERQYASDLTKQAGLAGILSEERIRIYRHFFGQRFVVDIPVDAESTNHHDSSEKDRGDLESQDAMSANVTINNSNKTSMEEQDNMNAKSLPRFVVKMRGADERTSNHCTEKDRGDLESQVAMSTNVFIGNRNKVSMEEQDKTNVQSTPEQPVESSKDTELEDNQDEPICPICLNEYGKNAQ